MNESNRAVKVGLFVLAGLVLMGALLIKFSKTGALFTPTYAVNLLARNVGGIKAGASVLMAGVPIGSVERIVLAADGRSVTIHLKILSRYRVHGDARFLIEQAGFLGDQYVAIIPTENKAPMLQDGAAVRCEEPFNLQEVARSASGMLQRVDQTVAKLNVAVSRVEELLLSPETLTNLTTAVSNFRALSDRALVAIDTVDRLLRTNTPSVNAGVSNLVVFTDDLKIFSAELRSLVNTNSAQFAASLGNIETATIQVNQILADVQQGRGLAGSVLKNPELEQHVSSLVSNLNVASSNLNKFGLWRFLWKPKQQ